MKRTVFFAAVVLATAGTSAFADTGVAGDISIETHPFVSSRTPAEVRAELGQYQRAGVNPWSTSYNPLKHFRSAKVRAEVEREYVASRDEVRGMTAEDSGASYMAQHGVRNAGAQLAGEPARAQ